jgi:cation diffusion facilitator family transporter
MMPERRTALVSVGAAVLLIGVKLAAGLASGSLGLVAEAAHSGTDLVAALLTFYAIGYARRPADASHLYGHGKAEHLAALGEAAVLTLLSLAVGGLAVARLTGQLEHRIEAAWWVFLAAGIVIVIDLARTVTSARAGRRHGSPALLSNALHFAGDLAGTVAVLLGLVATRLGWERGDSVAALFVALLVVVAALRLMQRNVDVLMDRAPAAAVAAVRKALGGLEPQIDVRQLRVRQAAGRAFVDLVIGVSPEAAVGQGHAVADRVETGVQSALPGADVVVHVEPAQDKATLREQVHAAAMSVSFVREVHDLTVIELANGAFQTVLHLKLPGDVALDQAHLLAEQVERAIQRAVPEIVAVHTHLEPLAEPAAAQELDHGPTVVQRIVLEMTGAPPRAERFLRTDRGLVVLLTLGLEASTTLADAHERASIVSREIRSALPKVADVIVHTEPRER